MTGKLLFINFLTLIRIIITIVIIPVYNLYGGFYVSLIVLIGYLTDSIDGILARHWHASTFFGAFFDVIADKTFTIMNFILLYLITPYAIIPIIIEISIMIVQIIKLFGKINVQSNWIGKTKVWILAVSVTLIFLVSDITNIKFLNQELYQFILNITFERLSFYILLPAIIMEILSLISYILEFFQKEKKTLKKTTKRTLDNKNYSSIWFSPSYYQAHKDDANIFELLFKKKNP